MACRQRALLPWGIPFAVIGDGPAVFLAAPAACVGHLWLPTGETGLSLGVAGYESLLIDVVINEGLLAGDDDALKDLLNSLLPVLFDQVLDGASVLELPEIDLSDMSDDLPEGTALKLSVGSVGRDGAYTAIEGGLE